MKHGDKESFRASFNYVAYDRFWAWVRLQTIPTDTEGLRRLWDKFYDYLPPIDKKNIDDYLLKHPSPRMQREHKQKSE